MAEQTAHRARPELLYDRGYGLLSDPAVDRRSGPVGPQARKAWPFGDEIASHAPDSKFRLVVVGPRVDPANRITELQHGAHRAYAGASDAPPVARFSKKASIAMAGQIVTH